MKKLLGLAIFLAVSLFFASFSYAKDFHKENDYIKIDIAVLGGKADISVTNIYRYQVRGNLAIFDTEPNDRYTNHVFYYEDLDLSKGETKKITYGGLDASQNKKYTLIYRAVNHQRTEVPFSTSWYGVVKGDETPDGGYKLSGFGDREDQRDIFIALNGSSEKPKIFEDKKGWVANSILTPLGKFSGSGSVGSTDAAAVSVPPDKTARYYVVLLAKESSGDYSILAPYFNNPIIFGTDKVGEIFFSPPTFKKIDTEEYELGGSLVADKHKGTDIVPLSTITVSAKFYDKKTETEFLSAIPIKLTQEGAGIYKFKIETKNFNPNTYYKLVVSFDSTTSAHAEYVGDVNTEKGLVPQTGKAADDFFDRNSYRLLAPIPGLVALLDPGLCQLEQQRNPGQICDINAFLNFILKLIIGLAAVVLVVRLIIEGYSYMITDTPFKKAAAKGAFKEALIGLVIALSSYLILNTINPKLVNNDVTIGVAEFEVKESEFYEYTQKEIQDIGPDKFKCPDAPTPNTDPGFLNNSRVKNFVCNYIAGNSKFSGPKSIVIHGTTGTLSEETKATNNIADWVYRKKLWETGARTITYRGQTNKLVLSSAHFLVDRDGSILQVLSLNKTGNHCGACGGKYKNSNSVGVEVVEGFDYKTNKWQGVNSKQIDSMKYLAGLLYEKYGLSSEDVNYHGNFGDPNRTKDEGLQVYNELKK